MQADQFEAPIERVWDAVVGEENRLPRLLDHASESEIGGGITGRIASGERSHCGARNAGDVDNQRVSVKATVQKWASPLGLSTLSRLRNPVSTPRIIRIGRKISLLATIVGAAAAAGCAGSVEQRGNLPNPDKMSEIHAGSTTKDQVVKMLGTPSSVSVFNNDKSWYYISRRTAQTAFFDPNVLDQQVYVLDFDDQGVVKAVDHKVLQDGKEITPVARATPAPGRELSFLEQVIGNLGKFNGSGGGTGAGGGGGPKGPSPNGGK
jgi:outer membrane protein assembly factor BamE (lipoprotein component of BamABCDE complex)